MILNLGKVAKRWFDCCFVQLLVKPAKNVCLGGPSKRRTVLDRLFILAEALAHGLVSRVVEHESLHDEVTSSLSRSARKVDPFSRSASRPFTDRLSRIEIPLTCKLLSKRFLRRSYFSKKNQMF